MARLASLTTKDLHFFCIIKGKTGFKKIESLTGDRGEESFTINTKSNDHKTRKDLVAQQEELTRA